MLSADISDVFKSILPHVASFSRLFSCPFKLERPDQIMSVYFLQKQMQLMTVPHLFSRDVTLVTAGLA